MKFETLGLSHDLLKHITKLGFEEPTEIQELSIPHILKGKDIIGESATGSGKTLAFGTGIVEKTDSRKGLQTLVLTPTRELAEQVKDALLTFCEYKHLSITSVYGGVAMGPQIRDIKRAEVVVATPGRLLDHLSRRTIDLSNIKVLVLDEADRMLDMGFIDDVEKIIRACPKKRQTLFFSATIEERIKKLSDKYLIDPVQVEAANQVDPSKLKQIYYDVPRNLKLSLLIHLMKEEKSKLIMLFCNTRHNTDTVVGNLKTNGFNAIAIHGGFSQNKRNKTLEQFNDAKTKVLVCTDVAARGLHIDNVSHVYNYDVPNDPKDYVHRIGRTARAGEEGKVINILCDYDYDKFSRVQQEYREFIIEKVEKPYLTKIETTFQSRQTSRPRGNSFRRNGGGNRGNGGGRGNNFNRSNDGNRGNNHNRSNDNNRSSEGNRNNNRSNDSNRSSQGPKKKNFRRPQTNNFRR